MEGSVHVKGFVYFHNNSGRISKSVGYATTGRSSIQELNTRSDINSAQQDAIHNATSRIVYFYNARSDVVYDYDFELTESKIVIYRGMQSFEKKRRVKLTTKRYTRVNDTTKIDTPITRSQADKELQVKKRKPRTRESYRSKTPQKRTFKSVSAYRKEKRKKKS
jgi:hypothetical protein